MVFAAAYAPPLRASMVPPVLNRMMTARSVYAAAAPCDSPVAASSPVPLGVASNVAVNEPFWLVNALFWNAVVLVAQPGAGPVTVMADVPLCPSLVALIVAVPATTPLTRPLPLTGATDVLLLDHVTTRPVSALPLASFGVAVSCTVWPATTLAGAGLTVTEATDTLVTVIADVPLCPSLVEVIVADPATTPLTRPLELTVATDVLLLDQVIVRPVSGVPLASLGVAVSCTVCPAVTVGDAGLTVTDATGTLVTVIADVPVFPSLVAVIVAEPATTPLTRPLAFTLATDVLLLDQVTTRPASGVPLASFGVAVSCTVWPCGTLAGAGLTVTELTATFVTVIAAVPLWPSLVAVIVADPGARAVTFPFTSAIATDVLLLDHVTVRPVSGLPFASFGVAVSWIACPAATVADAGLTLTVATGTVQPATVTDAVSDRFPGLLVATTLDTPQLALW